MTLCELLMAMLAAASFPSESFHCLRAILTGGLSDPEFLVILPFGLAVIVTASIFGAQWVVQVFDGEDRSS